jgi:hypothetical protein
LSRIGRQGGMKCGRGGEMGRIQRARRPLWRTTGGLDPPDGDYRRLISVVDRADIGNDVQDLFVGEGRVAALGWHVDAGCVIGVTDGTALLNEL